jgi:hypothetical protein
MTPPINVETGRINEIMSSLLLTRGQGEYINEMILPVVNVTKDAADIPGIGNDHKRIYSTKRSLKDTGLKQMSFSLNHDNEYKINKHDISIPITDEELNLLDTEAFNLEQVIAMTLNETMQLQMEYVLANMLTDTSVITQNSTPTNKWDTTNGTPVADINAVITTVRVASGAKPNYIIFGERVMNSLSIAPDIVGRASGVTTDVSRSLAMNIISSATGIPVSNMLVGSAQYITTDQAATEQFGDVWGENVIVYYRPMQAGRIQTSLGYRFISTRMAGRRMSMPNRRIGAAMGRVAWAIEYRRDHHTDYEVNWKYVDTLVNTSCAYLFTDVLST